MKSDSDYTRKLEHIIKNQLLPIYVKYYALTGEEVPPLDLNLLTKPIPALLKPKTDGVLPFTSYDRKARKN